MKPKTADMQDIFRLKVELMRVKDRAFLGIDFNPFNRRSIVGMQPIKGNLGRTINIKFQSYEFKK